MSTPVFVSLLFTGVLAVYVGIAVRTWLRLRGQLIVICPEANRSAAVTVDLGHAAATAVWEKADVLFATCSHWPERRGCDQACVAPIEASLDGTRARTIAARYFEGRRCVICQRRIAPANATRRQPGFMNPVSREVVAWDAVPAPTLPEAIESRRPLCADCTLAESSRHTRATASRGAGPSRASR